MPGRIKAHCEASRLHPAIAVSDNRSAHAAPGCSTSGVDRQTYGDAERNITAISRAIVCHKRNANVIEVPWDSALIRGSANREFNRARIAHRVPKAARPRCSIRKVLVH